MKPKIMKQAITIIAMFVLVACGSSSKDSNPALIDKKAQLKKLQDQQNNCCPD